MTPYRLLLTLAAPVFALRLALRRDEADERLGGNGPGAVRRGTVIWLHAASNGELTSARGLIQRILARLPQARMIVTCNTTTGRALVQGWGMDRVEVRLAPLDYRLTLRRFMGAWLPDALILIESELWPNRLAEMARMDRPVALLGARMSQRSAARWQRLPGLVRPALAAIGYLSAQDAASRARFVELGYDETRIGPVVDLKSGTSPTGSADPAELARLAPLFPRASTLLAASTHEGEEAVILRGFAQARRTRPDLRLILAPRHPRRASEIAAAITRAGLTHATRSAGEGPDGATPVYLADTMGEMALWYDLAGLGFVGGSLVDRGGHTPYEPAAHGTAILHGPHVANFTDIYGALDAAGGARPVADAEALTQALLDLDAGAQARMSDIATRVIDRMRSHGAGLDPLLAALALLIGEPALATPAPDEETIDD
ncbi:MAG: 3-deoxy-D-manno-octulosonic acid transferase [Rhodobacteraceae bacterium]|nr:3-deoxy-D-manno-octulosonic acid transferase [Paracoccaceae bacterium]